MTVVTDQTIGQSDEFTPIWGPHLPSAQMAKAAGAKYFFTGDICAKGHNAPRYTKDKSCTACREDNRRNNREKNRIEAREWRKNNPEKVKDQGRVKKERGVAKDYYKRTREKQIESAKAWNRANPEKFRENARRFQDANRQTLNERRTAKRRADPEAANRKMREYRETRRIYFAEASRRWRVENPEKSKTIDRNKKLRRRGAEGSHTHADVQSLLIKQNYKCAECGTDVTESYHVDHIMPIALGGSNWPSNLQILCPACNMEKHATDPIKFAQRKGRLL